MTTIAPTLTAPTRTVTWIAPHLLTVDHTVQRPLDKVQVARIAADFDCDALGVIHVSRRPDGTHHIIDGQHRIAAALAVGDPTLLVNCVLWEGLTTQTEAAMFRRLNFTKQPQPLDRFLIAIAEGDPTTCALNQLLNRHGWTVAKSKLPGSFFAVSALQKVYRKHPHGDLDTCDAVIRLATDAWGHDSNGLRAGIVLGFGAVLHRHPQLDIPKLVVSLAKYEAGPLGLIGKATGLRDIRGGLLPDAMAEILVNLHNARRQHNRLPAWSAS